MPYPLFRLSAQSVQGLKSENGCQNSMSLEDVGFYIF